MLKSVYQARHVVFPMVLLALMLCGGTVRAQTDSSRLPKKAVSSAVNEELVYLLGFFDLPREKIEAFSPQQIPSLLAFVSGNNKTGMLYYADEFNNCPSAYHEFTIPKSMTDFFRYSYNRDIMSVVTGPSSVRLAHWKSVDSNHQPRRPLWEYLPAPNPPLVITGVEHYVNTPDTFSGAYYEYDLDRILILFRHDQRNVLLSMSRQKGTSDVGKRGLILGDDDNWDYFYTARPGLTQPGLKWVESYMYDSYSVIVYMEPDPGKAPVRAGLFKWLRAGWAGFNLVRSKHIHQGLRRHEAALLRILNEPNLPSPDKLAATTRMIRNLTPDDLKEKTLGCLKRMASSYGDQLDFSEENYAGTPDMNAYVDQLTDHEMQSFVMLQWLKQKLNGHQTTTDTSPDDIGCRLQ